MYVIRRYCIFVSSSTGICSKVKKSTSQKIFCSSLEFEESNTDVNIEQRKKFEKWVEYCQFSGIPASVPENISVNDIQYFHSIGYHDKLNFIKSLSMKNKKTKKKAHAKVKSINELKPSKEERVEMQSGHIKYGLGNNTIYTKVSSHIIKDLYYHKMASAMLHSQPLILDLGFNVHMDSQQKKQLSKEILAAIAHNCKNSCPFNLTLCNVDFKSEMVTDLNIQNTPMNTSSQSYLDLYQRKNLVYLTRDAREEMKRFDPEVIYIIGGIVDGCSSKLPLTLAKSKADKLKTQRLPLDRYYIFKKQKTLNLDVVFRILLDLKITGSWETALENVPSNFIKTATLRQVGRRKEQDLRWQRSHTGMPPSEFH